MRIEARAKVNLTLEVLGERSDGYHALRSVVLPISLADTLEVTLTRDGELVSDSGYADDLCVRAARVLRAAAEAEGRLEPGAGVSIAIEKRIPVGGGLGGGSADAAATLVALNDLWRLGKSRLELARLGAAVGSDVPSLALGGAVRMEGRGEKVSPLAAARDLDLVLVNPGVFSSTGEVYRHCRARADDPAGESPTDALARALAAGDLAALAAAMVNDLEPPAVALHPEIGEALAALRSAGAAATLMSGSGSTVFALAESAAAAQRLAGRMTAAGYWAAAAASVL